MHFYSGLDTPARGLLASDFRASLRGRTLRCHSGRRLARSDRHQGRVRLDRLRPDLSFSLPSCDIRLNDLQAA
jgi:hypothetical protein